MGNWTIRGLAAYEVKQTAEELAMASRSAAQSLTHLAEAIEKGRGELEGVVPSLGILQGQATEIDGLCYRLAAWRQVVECLKETEGSIPFTLGKDA